MLPRIYGNFSHYRSKRVGWKTIKVDDIYKARERAPNTNCYKSQIFLNLTFFKTMYQTIGNSERGRDRAWPSQDSTRVTEPVRETKREGGGG